LLVVVRDEERISPNLPDMTFLIEMKEKLHVMGTAALQTIRYGQKWRLLRQTQPTPMDHGICQAAVPIVEALYLYKLVIVLNAFCPAIGYVAPQKASSGN
jgi:hypothetical protein